MFSKNKTDKFIIYTQSLSNIKRLAMVNFSTTNWKKKSLNILNYSLNKKLNNGILILKGGVNFGNLPLSKGHVRQLEHSN